jgi:hypothetical protein
MARSLVLMERTPNDASSLTYVDVADPDADDPYILAAHGNADNDVQARYALRANGLALKTYRTPLQVGIPQNSPILFDVGSYRPVISVSGLVEIESSREYTTHLGNRYFYPTMFQLQHAATQWNYLVGQEITLTVIHTNIASETYDQYNVAIQTCSFNLTSIEQTRWSFDLAFVATRPVSVNPSINS